MQIVEELVQHLFPEIRREEFVVSVGDRVFFETDSTAFTPQGIEACR